MEKRLGLLTALICTGLWSSIGSAGPNAGGTMVLAKSTVTAYCVDIPDYCGTIGFADCGNAVIRHDGPEQIVLNAVAAFGEGSSPRLSGVTFGLAYDAAQIPIVAFGSCGDFELSTADWPAPFEGTAVTWSTAQTTQLTEVYWFAAYNYYDPNSNMLGLAPHPTQGANFADDDVPSNIDPIASLGAFGFRTNGLLPCPEGQQGACCFDNGVCVVTTEGDCTAQGGTYQGHGTFCEPNPCSGAPIGACCFPDGSCAFTSQGECLEAGGSFQGVHTLCEPNPCPQPFGACCFPDRSCLDLTLSDCNALGGAFQGDGTDCDPNFCSAPIGACCFDDGSCVETYQDLCVADGGTYQGDSTVCDPNPCPEPTGACCFSDGSCSVLTENDCVNDGGSYRGNETDCDPNPCEPVPTIDSSWGRIKKIYR